MHTRSQSPQRRFSARTGAGPAPSGDLRQTDGELRLGGRREKGSVGTNAPGPALRLDHAATVYSTDYFPGARRVRRLRHGCGAQTRYWPIPIRPRCSDTWNGPLMTWTHSAAPVGVDLPTAYLTRFTIGASHRGGAT